MCAQDICADPGAGICSDGTNLYAPGQANAINPCRACAAVDGGARWQSAASGGTCGTDGGWENITPPISLAANNPSNNLGTLDLVIDPKTPTTVYVGTSFQGIWKSLDSGTTWFKVNTGNHGASLDSGHNWLLAIDPVETQVLYAAAASGSQGLWKSTNGGADWTQVLSPDVLSLTVGDAFTLAIDPTNHQHLLVSFHYFWNISNPAGLVESSDSGTSWTVHDPPADWGTGQAVFFLGNSTTWLVTTQNSGFWRTTDSGAHWDQVSTVSMTPGGEQLYRAMDGKIYAPAFGALLRSSDNGLSWQPVSVGTGTYYGFSIIGDGQHLYTQVASPGVNSNPPNSYYTSSETDGATWAPYNGQTFIDGPKVMAFDAVHGILFSSNWLAGVWRLRTP